MRGYPCESGRMRRERRLERSSTHLSPFWWKPRCRSPSRQRSSTLSSTIYTMTRPRLEHVPLFLSHGFRGPEHAFRPCRVPLVRIHSRIVDANLPGSLQLPRLLHAQSPPLGFRSGRYCNFGCVPMGSLLQSYRRPASGNHGARSENLRQIIIHFHCSFLFDPIYEVDRPE